MSPAARLVLDQLLALPQDERTAILDAASQVADHGFTPEETAELKRRVARYLSGESKGVSPEEAFRYARARYRAHYPNRPESV